MSKCVYMGNFYSNKILLGSVFFNLDSGVYVKVEQDVLREFFKNNDVLNARCSDNRITGTNRDLKTFPKYDTGLNLINSSDIHYFVQPEINIIKNALGLNATEDVSDRICGALVSGAIIDPESKRAVQHAITYYGLVRARQDDIYKIANNIGLDVQIVAKIKSYIFIEYHFLENGTKYSRFDPSFEIAQSWQRLIDGKNIQEHDLILIDHELYESNLVNNGMSQDEAHLLASYKYNYTEASRRYYLNLRR